ncbi:hypothetical protein LCGC14_2244180, partial [marine sediment metagenome]
MNGAMGLCVLLAVALAGCAGADAPGRQELQSPGPAWPKEIELKRRMSGKVDRIVDCHVHFRRFSRLEHFFDLRRDVGIDRWNIVSIVGPKNGEGNARCLYAKVAGKGAFYCFGGLNHLAYKSKGRVDPGSFAQQVDEMREAGFDGIKLIEGKPSVRRDWYPFPLDGDYYR